MSSRELEKILVVDDHVEHVMMILEALCDDYELRGAKDGFEALQEIARDPPDLILLDLIMPGMNGYEVIKEIRANPATRDIPIILITSLEECDETQALSLGASDFIKKPFSFPRLKVRIRNQLNLLRTRRALEKKNEELKKMAALREHVERITRHDLKNSLSFILNVPQLLMHDKNITVKQRELLKITESCARRMLEQIEQSFAIFKIETGSYQHEASAVDLTQLIGDVYSVLELKFTSRNVDFVLESSEEKTRFVVAGNATLLWVMCSNLIANALEASPEGGSVCVMLWDNDSGDAVIEIRNSGVIPPEIRAHFGEKYITHGKIGGTGLGVYSAQLIAKVHGGRLEFICDDRANTTTITVTLPECVTDAEPMTAPWRGTAVAFA